MLSWCDIEDPLKLIDPKLKIGKTLNQPLTHISQSEHGNVEKKLSSHAGSQLITEIG